MTRRTFYKRLRKIAPEFIWEFSSTDNIRGTRATNPATLYCPITAVYRKETGEYTPMLAFGMAGAQLGLSSKDSKLIANSADNFQGGHEIKTNPQVRKALLKAVGL